MKFNSIFILAAFSLTGLPSFAITTAEGCSGSQPLVDANVFNWRYYLNINSDLLISGINNATSACNHWMNSGALEGRQAHAGFHSKQYLSRYPDISAYYGASNYIASIGHYVNNGISEGRIGYKDNGINAGEWTTTISNNFDGGKIFIGTSKRSAGAIDSLIFDNIEFVNALDHGRQIQIASASSYGEGYNPTEAGSCNDGKGAGSSAIITSISAIGNSLSTTNTPAFWNQPGDNTPYGCGIGINGTKTSLNYQYGKAITIGGILSLPEVIRFNSQIKINENVPQSPSSPYGPRLAIEAPTGYMSGIFNRIFTLSNNANLTEITGSSCLTVANGCSSASPLIYATVNLSHAIGVCTGLASGAYFQPYDKYAAYGDLDSSSPIASTTKWAITKYIDNNVLAGTTVNFSSYMAVAKFKNGINAVEKVKSSLTSLNQLGYCF